MCGVMLRRSGFDAEPGGQSAEPGLHRQDASCRCLGSVRRV